MRSVQPRPDRVGAEEPADPLVGASWLARQSCKKQEQRGPDYEPGVGKTAIVEGLAQKIVYGDVPHFADNILALDISLIVVGRNTAVSSKNASRRS